MRKLKLDKKGLSPLVAVIVLLTLVMVLGAIIAGTLSGAPRPVLPATTAVNLSTPYGGNPMVGDTTLILRNEYGAPIDDAWMNLTPEHAADVAVDAGIYWCEMKMLINGEVVHPDIVSATSNSVEVTEPELEGLSLSVWLLLAFQQDPSDVEFWGQKAKDFAVGDQLVLELDEPLESSDLIQVLWGPRDMMLVQYLVQ